jgi:hypothetical protein
MFIRRLKNPTLLEVAMDQALRAANRHPAGSEEYFRAMDVVFRLNEMVKDQKSTSLSKDTMLVVGGNLLGILMILQHEHLHPISTKALGLLIKTRP